MSRRSQTLTLPLSVEEAASACRSATLGLGWRYERISPGVATASEDPTLLHCHCHPLRAEVRLSAAAEGETTARIRGQVPGWGPIATKHVREQTDLLARRIGVISLRRSREQQVR